MDDNATARADRQTALPLPLEDLRTDELCTGFRDAPPANGFPRLRSG